jgi:hypothetical protein
VYFLIKRCREINRPILFQQRVRGVPDNRQQPGSGVGAMESAEGLKCAQIGLLNDILRILFVTEQPSRQVVRGVHVGQHHFLKRRQFVFLSGALFLMLLKYGEFHNPGARLETFGVKSIFGF